MRVAFQPAYILHYRPYRETSLLLDLFSQDHGRIALVSRGTRKSRSPTKALLQPFNPLLISFQGKSELMNLIEVEPNGPHSQLRGDCLLSGFYLNELLMRVLQKHDPHPRLYAVYQQTLLTLQSMPLQQKTLRLFEKKLLEELGYGLQLAHDFATGAPLIHDKNYRFYPEFGFKIGDENDNPASAMIFSGKSLLALAREELEDPEVLRDAKRLMRQVLGPLLGPQPLQSRKLFIEVEK